MTHRPCPFCTHPPTERRGFLRCGNSGCWMNDIPGVLPEIWNNQPARVVLELSRDEIFYFLTRQASQKAGESYHYLDVLKDRFTQFLKTPEKQA